MLLTVADLKNAFFHEEAKIPFMKLCRQQGSSPPGHLTTCENHIQNKGSWLLRSQKYSGSRADVNIIEADSELEAHLGTLDLLESFFFSCVSTQRDQPIWWWTTTYLTSLEAPQGSQRGDHRELKSPAPHCLWKESSRKDTDTLSNLENPCSISSISFIG